MLEIAQKKSEKVSMRNFEQLKKASSFVGDVLWHFSVFLVYHFFSHGNLNQEVLNPTPLNPTPATWHKRKRKLRCNFRSAALQKLHCNIRFCAMQMSF